LRSFAHVNPPAKAGWDHYAKVGDASTGSDSIDTYNVGVGIRF